MEAKVISTYYMNSIVLFSGREYTKLEWRPVPAGKEAEAQANENLETRERVDESEVVNEVKEEVKPSKPSKSRKAKFVEEEAE